MQENFLKAVKQKYPDQEDYNKHLRDMEALRGLAMEVQQMDDYEKEKTLLWLDEKLGHNERDFWCNIVMHFIVYPQTITKALRLTDKELNMAAVAK
jgi:hypothetical protein